MINQLELELIGAKVKADARYGEEYKILRSALLAFPDNTDSTVIAMKIALVDMTNSTQLSRLLGEKVVTKKDPKTGKYKEVSRSKKDITLGKIAEQIIDVNFDGRVARGDRSLVGELARWSQSQGVNLFSFFSKYCCYHNELLYGRDDYSIYDSVVQNHLGDYISAAEYETLFGAKPVLRSNQTMAGLVRNKIEQMRKHFDYDTYVGLIDQFLAVKGITCDNKRRKLDWKIWYDNRRKLREDSMGIPQIYTDSGDLRAFLPEARQWLGIPGIERSGGGRLFVTFYSGGAGEGYGNYCALLQSDDDGATWRDPVAAVYAGDSARCFDPCLWIDPLGRLWWTFSVQQDCGVWYSVCENPDAPTPTWPQPRRLADGVMMNKPLVTSAGDWLFPVAVWRDYRTAGDDVKFGFQRVEGEKKSFVYRSRDAGAHFERLGGADVPQTSFDEHMLIEQSDGSLRMLVRTLHGAGGIGEALSRDGGLTWKTVPCGLSGPSSRFYVRTLPGDSVLLLYHADTRERRNLAAMLSTDGGATFPHRLMIDARDDVSYPDAALAPDGTIYMVYDRDRYGAKEILMAKFTQADILAGKIGGGILRVV